LRRLALKKETLADLTPGELTLVAGGAIPTVDRCLTGIYPSLPPSACVTIVTTIIVLPPPTE
jgi:hypothetical protein